MNKQTYIIIVISILSSIGFSQTGNKPIPEGLMNYDFHNQGFNENGYFLSSLRKLFAQSGDDDFLDLTACIFDSAGYVAWYSQPGMNNLIDFKHYPSNIFSFTGIINQKIATVILDEDFNVIDTIQSLNTEQDVHDIQLANNGNWLISTIHFDTVDLSSQVFDGVTGDAETVLRGYGVEELDPSGDVIFEWNSNDYIDPSDTYDETYGYAPDVFDYCHGNAIEEDTDGNLLFSMRHLNAIYKVDRISGSVIWILGGKSSDFTFVNDAGFSGQHDVRIQPNGNLTVFDNANMGPTPRNSRGVEYELDIINGTATLVKETPYVNNLFASAMGGYQQTTNFDVLNYGLIYRPNPSVTIMDHSQSVLAEFYFQDSVVSYRTQYTELNLPQRQAITCEWTGTEWTLNAPSGEAEYKWSTGETTQSITLSAIGEYQVWTPYGIGYIGTEPFLVTDINNPCAVSDITVVEEIEKMSFILYDLLGRPLKEPLINAVYVKVYSNGEAEKLIRLE